MNISPKGWYSCPCVLLLLNSYICMYAAEGYIGEQRHGGNYAE
jgi:hypothetical protein